MGCDCSVLTPLHGNIVWDSGLGRCRHRPEGLGVVIINGDGGCGLIKRLISDVETHRSVQVRSGAGWKGGALWEDRIVQIPRPQRERLRTVLLFSMVQHLSPAHLRTPASRVIIIRNTSYAVGPRWTVTAGKAGSLKSVGNSEHTRAMIDGHID